MFSLLKEKIPGARTTSKQAGFETLEKGEWFSDVISEKIRAHNLAGEFVKFLRKLIANQKYKLAVAAKWS